MKINAKGAARKLTYLPFVGWLVSLAVHRNDEDEFLFFHIKQSFVAAAAFTALLILFGTALIFAGRGSLYFKFVVTLVVYLLYAAYLAVSVIGTAAILKEKQTAIFLIGKAANKLTL